MQAISPGCPAVLGSFLSTTDLKNGSPAFGGPESLYLPAAKCGKVGRGNYPSEPRMYSYDGGKHKVI